MCTHRYAIVDAASVGLTLIPAEGAEICRLGEMIKVRVRARVRARVRVRVRARARVRVRVRGTIETRTQDTIHSIPTAVG